MTGKDIFMAVPLVMVGAFVVGAVIYVMINDFTTFLKCLGAVIFMLWVVFSLIYFGR